jgi:cobalt transporter subunit CbtA
MIKRMLVGGVLAGFAAGLFAALLHFAFVQKLILLGEQYETGALVHFEGGAAADQSRAAGSEADHSHAAGAAAHVHTPAPGADAEPTFTRDLLTVIFTCLIYAAYGILLVAGFGLAEQFGRRIDAREGLLWGLAGFAAFQLAPAMGLAPELPGSIAADLSARQVWWLGTVLATGTGLALLGYGRTLLTAVLGGALLAAPHVIGAPHLDEFYGAAPPELSAAFSANVLGVGFAVWAVLGWLAGRLWARSAD